MRIKPIIIVYLLGILFASCEFDESDIQYNLGNDFINDPSTVIMIDTLTVSTFTTTVDSFATSRSYRFLTGTATSHFNVVTSCETYLCFDMSSASAFHASAQFDSVRLVLELDGYNCGDTTMAGDFGVYRLTEEVSVNSNSGYLYNTSHFASEDQPTGTFKIDFNQKEKAILVELDNEFGKDLFQLTADESEIVKNKDLFLEYFKGFVIRPLDGKSKFVAGINGMVDSLASPRIRIYYHDNTINDDLYFDFPLEKYEMVNSTSSSGNINYRSFNHIENHYEGTVLEGIQAGEAKLSSNLTDNATFMQAGSMLQTRIEFPSIDALYSFGVGSIVKAELQFEPVEGTFNQAEDLPSKLQITLVDDKNRYYNPLYITGTTDAAYGNLHFNSEFKTKTNYTYDITNFLKSEYEDKGDPIYSLMMSAPFDSQYPSIDQLIIGSSKNVNNKMKLKIYLTNY